MNDEIERKLFGSIDSMGADAVRAFTGTDVHKWITNFEAFFAYVDAQKLRTPKGLDWLRAQYPSLDQNELMIELQGLRMLHCTIWSGAVREIVSAEDSDVKFIVTDHPVTVYNHVLPPEHARCRDGNEPSIALKGSQTIFPLNRDLCLILTNLEYARDPAVNPLEKRTFARNYSDALVKTDEMIRERKLSAMDVARINYVLKKRARRFIAAGKEDWLYPENVVKDGWGSLKSGLLPPNKSLWRFGGEIFAELQDGRVHYQDEFGRTEKQWDFLQKASDARSSRPNAACGCGSGRRFRDCCKLRPIHLRPSWNERSIRERNLFLQMALVKELGLDAGNDWAAARAALTDEQIKRVYSLYAALWPRETDLLHLLPKPDGTPRAVYTGCLHPNAIAEFAVGASLYFGEIVIEHPFLHAGCVRREYSPVENPRAYRQEFLKSVVLFLTLMPLVDAGLVHLVPDPGNFDSHLRNQVLQMAKARWRGVAIDPEREPRMKELMRKDAQRSFLALPHDALRRQLKRSSGDVDEAQMTKIMEGMDYLRRTDPLAVLQEGTFDGGQEGGLMNMWKLAPNFEMAMYMAQAVGGSIVTDSLIRWEEMQRTIRYRPSRPAHTCQQFSQTIKGADFAFVQQPSDIIDIVSSGVCGGYASVMKDAARYALVVEKTGEKKNLDAGIAGRFSRAHAVAQKAIRKAGVEVVHGSMNCACPWGGFQNNSVNRLLLMSSSEHHLRSVPMIFYMSRPGN